MHRFAAGLVPSHSYSWNTSRKSNSFSLVALGRKVLVAASVSLVASFLTGCSHSSSHVAKPLREESAASLRAGNSFSKSLLSRLKPQSVAGMNGTSTGVADFAGNMTAISVTSPQSFFVLQRQADCTLTLFAGNTALNANPPQSGTSTYPVDTGHYEQVLHQEAGLTTTADTFANGCTPINNGAASAVAVYAGENSTGVGAFASTSFNATSQTNVLSTLVYNFQTAAFSTAEDSNPTVANVNEIASADLNGDGIGDLVLPNAGPGAASTVTVLLGNADGTFGTPATFAAGGDYTTAVVLDDVNGDGKQDIVAIANDQQFSVFLGNGDGTFQNAQSFAAPALPGYSGTANITGMITADLRGTGKRDLICSNGLVLLGNGDGTFTASSAAAFPFNPNSANPRLASGDLNNDGKLDLVTSDGYVISTWTGNGDGTFTPGSSYASIGNSGYVTVADLDGDGNADIYSGLSAHGLFTADDSLSTVGYALMGNGDGSLRGAPNVSGPVGGVYTGTNLGDVNGDGYPDLITLATTSVNAFTNTFNVLLGSQSGAFTNGSTVSVPASAMLNGTTVMTANQPIETYAVGDVNGDGKADLVFLTAGAQDVTFNGLIYWVALSNGDGTFATPVPHLVPAVAPAQYNDSADTVSGLQIADFNHDNHADLLFSFTGAATSSSGNIYLQGFTILTGNGDGTFSATPVITTTYNSATAPSNLSTNPVAVSTTDLTGDGIPDLLTVNLPGTNNAANVNTTLQVFVGKGDGTFAAPNVVTTAPSLQAPHAPYDNSPCALADFNHDGHTDLACLGSDVNGNSELAISLGHGDGTFATATPLSIFGGTVFNSGGIEGGVAAADFNGDSKIDLALIIDHNYSGILYGI